MCRKMVYQPPPAEWIEAYAQQICEYLAETNEAFDQHEVIWGFTEFIKLMSEISARKLNEAAYANVEYPHS